MINMGCEFYMQSVVEDVKTIFVNVGLGFHVQMTMDEALAFTHTKEKELLRYEFIQSVLKFK